MNYQPLVSVLIPCYNQEDYLEECLDSIKSQTYKNIEIIFIDDGSIDNSFNRAEKKIHELGFKTAKLIRQDNIGLLKTLNKMLDISLGEYLCICAADDKLTHSSIEDRVNALINSSKEIVFGDAYLIDSSSFILAESSIEKLFRINPEMFNKFDVNESLIYNWCVPGPVTMIKRTFFTKFRYDESKIAEDRPFYLEGCLNNVVCYLPSKVAFYRFHEQAITKSNRKISVWLDVASTNYEYSKKFRGLKMLYLSSFAIDKVLLKNYSQINKLLHFFVKAIRKSIVLATNKLLLLNNEK